MGNKRNTLKNVGLLSANAKKVYLCVGENWEGMNKSEGTYFVRIIDSLACGIFLF